jgi:hypothetical protein
MSEHDDCNHHNHDHYDPSEVGLQDNLYLHINRSNVVALNALGGGPEVIKPWHERLDEEVVRRNIRPF